VSLHRETNLIMITDTTANIRRLLDILKLADVKVALDELQIIPIRNADAQEAGRAPEPDVLHRPPAHGRGGFGLNVPPPPPLPAVPGAPRSRVSPVPI
jgi:hypothetical protein